MEIEEDDLPDGYPDVWGLTVHAIKIYGRTRMPGMTRRYDMGDEAEKWSHSKRFYERAKRDPEWVAKRNATKRAKYHAQKTRGKQT